MAPKGIKASKLFQKKSKAKLVEWKARERSRGMRYVPVEVSTSKNQQIPGRNAVRMEIDNHEAMLHEADPPSMDVDKSFWIGGPNVPEQRRVRLTSCPFLMSFDVALSPSAPTWKILFLELAAT